MLPLLGGLAALAGRYDAAILDLWGVLHDGVQPTPGALVALAGMRAAGWRLVVLSNAPRTLDSTRAQVARLGIPPGSYDAIVTSGELARVAVAARADAWHAKLGRRFYHLGPERDWGLFDGLGCEVVQTPERAHFVLNTGLFDDENETAADYAGLLDLALRRKLPMLCANPDRFVYRGTRRLPCAGEIGVAYEAIGGDAYYHGKPYPAAYAACFHHMQGVPPSRVLAVGDSLTTDIAGANAAGIDSVLVLSGLHVDQFAVSPGAAPDLSPDMAPDLAKIEAGIAASGARPTMLIADFQW